MYGTQATSIKTLMTAMFENDVKMYGTQAETGRILSTEQFENDVKMYGTQAHNTGTYPLRSLRMM